MRGSRAGKLAVTLTVGLLALSACASGSGASDQEGDYKVEVMSWWSGPGEEDGLNALVDDFRRREPSIEFVNASVGGGAGNNARAVLATRLQADDPPDSYQAHVGVELRGDIKAGKLEDLNALYDRQGWRDRFPPALLDAVTVNGKIYSVPVGIHRSNLMWYNPKTLANLGLSAPKTWEEFLAQTSVIKAKGIVPIALGPDWTQKHLLENVLLGELGSVGYSGLWTGATEWDSDAVTRALTMYTRVIANSDIQAAAGDWQPMLDKVTAGSAAYVVMGDWSDAYLRQTRKLTYQTDYAVAASPGSAGVYNYLADSFTLPKGAPHRAAAEKWLVQCGTAEAQDQFSLAKGALPARIDANTSKYGGYLASALLEWRNPGTKVVGSLTHGSVVNTTFNAQLDAAIAKFVDDADPYAFAEAAAKAAQASRS